MTLDEIAIKHGCDKSSIHHDYCRIYEKYFKSNFADNYPLSLLEIGYGGYDDPDKGGESARMWKEFMNVPTLPGSITITDIHPKRNWPGGVEFLLCDVTDKEDFALLYFSAPHYDIIIDDGSHLNADIIAAFKNLWPVLNPGGLYCIEDVHSSYDPYYKDSNTYPGAYGTAMLYFTTLTHSVNSDFILPMWRDDKELRKDIEFIHFYKELIIIKKKAA